MFKASQLLRTAAARLAMVRSSAPTLPETLREQGIASCVVIHFDGFFTSSEARDKSIDRLKAALGWICRHYEPISLAVFRDMISRGEIKDNAVLLTCDCSDRRLDLAFDQFRYVNAPVTGFINVGQTMLASGDVSDSLGEMLKQLKGSSQVALQAPTWTELHDFARLGMTFGTTGVSKRTESFSDEAGFGFEVKQASAVLQSNNISCDAFMMCKSPDLPASRVTQTLRSEGFMIGLVQEPGFITAHYDPSRLPVITIPQRLGTLNQFRAYASGANVGVGNGHLRSGATRAA